MKKDFDVEQAKKKLENLKAFIASPSHKVYVEHIQKELQDRADYILTVAPDGEANVAALNKVHGAREAYTDCLSLFEDSRDVLVAAITEYEAENPVAQTT